MTVPERIHVTEERAMVRRPDGTHAAWERRDVSFPLALALGAPDALPAAVPALPAPSPTGVGPTSTTRNGVVTTATELDDGRVWRHSRPANPSNPSAWRVRLLGAAAVAAFLLTIAVLVVVGTWGIAAGRS